MQQRGQASLHGVRTRLLAVCICAFVSGCLPGDNKETTVLTWRDSDSALTFSVTVRELIAHNISRLKVSRDGAEVRAEQLDDDVRLATLCFLRKDNWLLVLNDQYVLGGYNFSTDELFGEFHSEGLPFTVWKGGGTVVATAKVGQTDHAGVPAGFKRIDENAGDAPGEQK